MRWPFFSVAQDRSPYELYTDIIARCERIAFLVEEAGGIKPLLAQYNDMDVDAPPEFDAVRLSYIHIGEAVVRLGATAELDAPDFPWKNVASFRHNMAHNYEDIALRYVREALVDLDNMKATCELQRTRYDLNRPGFRAPEPQEG